MKIGWPANVNKIIIDSTTLTMGEGAVENELENGKFETWLKSSCVPDTINVTMDFDFFELDEYGLSEFDRFRRWFKYSHKCGTVPFEFPTIYNTDENNKKFSTYRIKGTPSFSKRGLCNRTTMTWIEEFNGTIEIPKTSLKLEEIYAENGTITLLLASSLLEDLTTNTFDIEIKKDGEVIPFEITNIEIDRNVATYNFEPFTEEGTYTVSVYQNGVETSNHFRV